MSNLWDGLWSEFASAIERLNEAVHPEARGFLSKLERSANDMFPLRALASYSPVAASGDERLVISLDVNRQGSRVVARADLARGDGLILDEEDIVEPISEAELEASPAALGGATEALALFVERQYDKVAAELGPEQ